MNERRIENVKVERIPHTKNHFGFLVDNDVVEMKISFPNGAYFENLETTILFQTSKGHSRKAAINTKKLVALYGTIYDVIHRKYLQELTHVFYAIACEPASETLQRDFTCVGHVFEKGSTPKEIFDWFFYHYTSPAANGNFEVLVKLIRKGYFFGELSFGDKA